jgi:hypothetical protein
MTIGKQKVTFHWKNYFAPTPSNLERISTFVRDTLAGASALSIFTKHEILATYLALSIIVVGQLTKFFASVASEAEKDGENLPS